MAMLSCRAAVTRAEPCQAVPSCAAPASQECPLVVFLSKEMVCFYSEEIHMGFRLYLFVLAPALETLQGCWLNNS